MGTQIRTLRSTTETLDVAKSLKGKQLLVTGCTGFLGKVWLSFILDKVPDIEQIWLLIRPNKEGAAIDRFTRIAETSPVFRPLKDKHGEAYGTFMAERIAVLDGDVSESMCGLSEDVLNYLAPRIDMVLNFAGLVDFDPDPLKAMSANIVGAMNVADLVECFDDARLVHISTCYVAGMVSGHVSETLEFGVSPTGLSFSPSEVLAEIQRICREVDEKHGNSGRSEAREARVKAVREYANRWGWPNIYTVTKSLAEHQLLGRKLKSLTIVRPAVIESARTFPFPGWNEGINTSGPIVWFLQGYFQYLPCCGSNHFDVIPVDTVVRAVGLIVAASLDGVAEPVYQLGSSQTNPFTFDRALELTNLAIRRDFGSKDAKSADRLFRRFFDSVSRSPDVAHPLSVPSVNRVAKGFRRFMVNLDISPVVPKKLSAFKETIHGQRDFAVWYLDQAIKGLGRLEWMLDVFRPFIYDHDYIFGTENVRALHSALPEDHREEFGWDMETLDWRTYWLDVHYPGLTHWSLPLLRGAKAPKDAAVAVAFDGSSKMTTRNTTRSVKAVS
jgi:nucleoside-diphosphate-sugar epimerase